MSKHMIIGHPSNTNFRLPDDSDLDVVRSRLTNAVQHGGITEVDVVINTGPLVVTPLLVNGNTIEMFCVFEI